MLILIGARLAEIRKDEGFTQVEMARVLGIKSSTYLSMVETKGYAGVNMFTYLIWAANKGYNLNWILLENNALESKKNLDSLDPNISKIMLLFGKHEGLINDIKKLFREPSNL